MALSKIRSDSMTDNIEPHDAPENSSNWSKVSSIDLRYPRYAYIPIPPEPIMRYFIPLSNRTEETACEEARTLLRKPVYAA